MSTGPRPSSFAVTLAGILSLAVAMGIGRFAFTPLLPLMMEAGGLDVAAGGWIAAANYAGYLAGAVTASRLRWSAVRLGTVALVLTALLTAAMALPLGAAGWAALRFIAGVCSAWAFVATAIWCLGALASQGRAQLAGAVYSGVGFGIAAAGLFCLVAASLRESPQAIWIELGVIAGLGVLPIVLTLRRLQAAPANNSTASATPSARTAAMPGVRGLVVCYGALGFGYILPATFLPVLARTVVADPRLFGLAWPVFGITAAASTFIAGWLMRRATRLKVWAGSNLVMGAGVMLPSLWLNGWTIALSALFVGGTFMIVTLAGVQEVRARAVGDATPLVARMTAAFALGQIAGPIAASLLLRLPAITPIALNVALQLAALSQVAAAAWLWRMERALPPTETEMSHAR